MTMANTVLLIKHAALHGIRGGACQQCRQWRAGYLFLDVGMVVRTVCAPCRVKGPRADRKGRRVTQPSSGVDVLATADSVVGPRSPGQRRWAYIVARRWWIDAGLHVPLQIDGEAERARLLTMQQALEEDGVVCVFPDCPSPYMQDSCPPSR